ncbi:MAG: hypothetical protein N2448_04315 [Caloramator sp.]|nr:hypothetical protein [Caloramator sp.]
MGRPKVACRSWQACMQPEGRFCMVGKSFIAVELIFDCSRVPTYHAGSS